ncbi:RidA family protein [Paenibacillus koleovorans]|uniref:RidA family protein n=1 Tax=Paenibacillus koleovorans TaxID=121608 RepID=UPI000FDAC7AE|nr:RidA family protein [Paenibacillus koleovorans]
MTPKQIVESPRVHSPFGHYSSAVLRGNHLYMSGFGPFDTEKRLVGDNIADQTHMTMRNIKNFLEDNGFTMDDIVRATVYLNDIADWSVFNEVYGQYFESSYPARTVVACQLNGFLVEVECTAIKGE